MGIYDRAYYQDENQPGFELGNEPSMTTKLVILNVVVFLANMFLGRGNWLLEQLAITPETLRQPWLWWQLLTYGFAHSPDVRHIFWNMFALWMFGRDVEAVYGRKEFLRLYLVMVLFCGLTWTVRNLFYPTAAAALGASGAITGVVMLFVFLFPKRTILLMFVFPVPAWVLGVITIAFNVFGMGSAEVGGGGPSIAYDIHLAGAVFAALYFWLGWNFGRLLPGHWGLPTGWLRRRPSLRIHDPQVSQENIDAAGDRVLEKLHREGESKLTRDERRILEEYSRRMRQKHQ